MSRFVGVIKKKNRRLFYATFLIAIGIALCFLPQWKNHVPKKNEPVSSQSGLIEISRLVDAKIECEQDQIVWVNWSILNATGFSFEIHQNSSGKGKVLNFGTIGSDFYAISCLTDTSQPGSFIVSLVVWNSTLQSSDEILLSIQPIIEDTFRFVFVGVAGSVAVATNFTAMIYWRKQRLAVRGRKVDRDWVLPDELPKLASKDDQLAEHLYLSSTALVQMEFLQDNTKKVLSVENFKKVEDPNTLQDTVLQLISNPTNRLDFKINYPLLMTYGTLFLNYLRFETKNVAVVTISSKSLHQTFISTLKSTIDGLLLNTKSADFDPTEIQLKINLVLHLDRSRDFQLPLQSKMEILQESTQWKTPLDEKELITQDEMGQVQRDLEDMSPEEIQKMLKFLENGKKIFENSKEEPDDETGSRV